jgi:hypothetical protein
VRVLMLVSPLLLDSRALLSHGDLAIGTIKSNIATMTTVPLELFPVTDLKPFKLMQISRGWWFSWWQVPFLLHSLLFKLQC